MTTIAYDGRYIAADGRSTIGSLIVSDIVDKFYVRGNRIFALCGSSEFIPVFVDEFVAYKEVSHTHANEGGFLFEEGKVFSVFIDEDTKLFRKNITDGEIWAEGSGRDFALAAMDLGKSAIDAVRYAATRNTGTGGAIRCFDTKTGKFTKAKC